MNEYTKVRTVIKKT